MTPDANRLGGLWWKDVPNRGRVAGGTLTFSPETIQQIVATGQVRIDVWENNDKRSDKSPDLTVRLNTYRKPDTLGSNPGPGTGEEYGDPADDEVPF